MTSRRDDLLYLTETVLSSEITARDCGVIV